MKAAGTPSKVRVQRERNFAPHHILLATANMALENAEKKQPGWMYYELTALMFSALAIEALANSFGEKLVIRWKDYESASPVAKVRILANQLSIDADFNTEPWSAILWLVKFRNGVAHARPESVKFDEVMLKTEFKKIERDYPKAKLEKDITLNNAKRAVAAVENVFDQFCGKLDNSQLNGLISDGFSGIVSGQQE